MKAWKRTFDPIMKTVWHWSAFHITGPLWGEIHRWPVVSNHKGTEMQRIDAFFVMSWTSWWTNKFALVWESKTLMWYRCNAQLKLFARLLIKLLRLGGTRNYFSVPTKNYKAFLAINYSNKVRGPEKFLECRRPFWIMSSHKNMLGILHSQIYIHWTSGGTVLTRFACSTYAGPARARLTYLWGKRLDRVWICKIN